MQGIIAHLVHQPVGRHGGGHVAGFQGNHDIVKARFLQQLHVIQGAVHHALGGKAAVLGQDVLFQGTGVDPDADGHMVHLGAVRHPAHLLRAADVAGVDAHFVNAVFHGGDGQRVVKMNVRHQRHRALIHQPPHRPGARPIVHRNAHQIAPRRRQLPDLLQGGGHVPGVRIGHGLNGNRRAAADQYAARLYLFCCAHNALRLSFGCCCT